MPSLTKAISVVIPVCNERENLRGFISRITTSLRFHSYELIFIDDHSRDGTSQFLQDLATQHPQVLYEKKRGKKGKAYSLHQGFAKAKYDLIAMIDADLSYPPEALPQMITKLQQHHIVVAHRTSYNGTNWLKKILSRSFRRLGKAVFGLDYDIQAGLKVFHKQVLDWVKTSPGRWSFDLEFLLKAFHYGLSIGSVDVDYHARKAGRKKLHLIPAIWELGWMAVKLRIWPIHPLAFKPSGQSMQGAGIVHKGKTFVTHSSLPVSEGAFFTVTNTQLGLGLVFLFTLGILLGLGAHSLLVSFISLLSIFYFLDLLFQIILVTRTFGKNPQVEISPQDLAQHAHRTWPTYTIFCPLYKETAVIPQFIEAMNKLDYPKDRLEILLLLEEDDKESIAFVQKYNPPSYFKILVVPDSNPKTKPKACNYGLAHAKGEYTVIYDAEDIPDPLQLKKAVLSFERHANQKVICVQAKLNFYNPNQNLLTRFFTAEYSLWFDLILTGLQSVHAPIPLGGTSNHFRTQELHRLKGWDPFNVTEDCDLGIRLIKKGYRTLMMDSTTMEEANSDLKNWFRQRSRWIKGYIQTYLVHMRRPGEFRSDLRYPNILTFQLTVGGKILSLFVNPLLWAMTISYFVIGGRFALFIESIYLGPIFYIAVASLVIGNFFYLFNYMMGCAQRQQWELIKYAYLVPLYWLMMSISAWIGLYQLIFKPHYWEKTVHGLHLNHAQNHISVTHAIAA